MDEYCGIDDAIYYDLPSFVLQQKVTYQAHVAKEYVLAIYEYYLLSILLKQKAQLLPRNPHHVRLDASSDQLKTLHELSLFS